MAKRTQIVCLHEGKKGASIDPIFIRILLQALDPSWLRPWTGSLIRTQPCGGRSELISKLPSELRACLSMGGMATLMVWADVDDKESDGQALKDKFWKEAEAAGIAREEFEKVVFIFAKDRIENWIQFLLDGHTDEKTEGPRIKKFAKVGEAARKLAKRCARIEDGPPLPASLEWSCKNWRQLVKQMGS